MSFPPRAAAQTAQATAMPPAPMAESSNFSRPTTANNASNTASNNEMNTDINTATRDAAPTVPTTATATTAPGATPHAADQPTLTETPQTLNEQLNTSDRYWKFKFMLLGIATTVGLIGVGSIGWILSTRANSGYSYYAYDDFWELWPTLLTFSISIVWCFICMLVFLVRKRAVHPGVRVSMDLLLWLGLIVTALFAMAAYQELLSWGDYGSMGSGSYSSRDGDYYLASNNTWVWEPESGYTTADRDCTGSSGYQERHFSNCAEQDAYVNKLWSEKSRRQSVELAGVVCQFISLVMHFALFVWACVDTHYYNRTKVSKDAEKLAAGIVHTMIQNGAIVPPPGQAYMRPQQGQGMYYQLSPQQQQQQQAYQMASWAPQNAQQQQWQQQYHQQMVAQSQGHYRQVPTTAGVSSYAPAAGPSNEKGQVQRYS